MAWQEPDGNAAAEDSSQDESDADSEADADNVPAKAPKIAELNTDLKAAKQSKGSKWGALSQDVVDQWCKDAKEHRSVAALEKLVKVTKYDLHSTHYSYSNALSSLGGCMENAMLTMGMSMVVWGQLNSIQHASAG